MIGNKNGDYAMLNLRRENEGRIYSFNMLKEKKNMVHLPFDGGPPFIFNAKR